ncbi:MAG: hypothetical protein QFB87_00750 [Patescibacteria group bacterium]|nr:hypothetical protein [Patescibacteria group bacterium]
MSTLSRKRILVVLACLLAGVFALSFLLPVSESGPTINQRLRLPKILSSAVTYNEHSILYSAGSNLATYDIITGKISPLGPVDTVRELENIDNLAISEDKKYAIFHLDHTLPTGLLSGQLLQLKLPVEQDYWWKYDFNSQKFAPLPGRPLLAKIYGNTIYTLGIAGAQETINTYNTSDLKPVKTISVPAVSDFYITKGGIVLQKTNHDVLLTSDGVVSTVLLKAATVVGVASDQNHLFVLNTESNTRTLSLVSVDDASKKIIEKRVVDKPVVMNGIVLYSSGRNQDFTDRKLHTFNTTTQKKQTWQLSDDAVAQKNNPATPITLIGDSAAIVTDNTNYYLIGGGLAKLPQSLAAN